MKLATTTTSSRGRPRLLVLASTYPRWAGDPEPGFVHELCRRLATCFEVIAIVPDAPHADASGVLDGVPVLRYRYAPRNMQTLVNDGGIAANLRRSRWKWLLLPGFLIGQYLAARRVLKSGGIDVIHAHWLLPQGWVARRLAHQYGVPYLVTSHGGDLFGLRSKAATAIKKRVAASCAAMTVVSHAMQAEALRQELNAPRIEVLPMGVDLRDRFVPDSRIARELDRLLFVGRLVAKKGLVHLLDAMPQILAARPDVVLDIAGFGPEEEALRAKVKALHLHEHVRFLGARAQAGLPDLYRRASVFVAPFVRDPSGDQEGLPVVLMEAIGCGCPVVVGSVAGVHDLLGADADAVSVPCGNAAALAAAVIAALDDPETSRARAERIRQAAVDLIDWQHIAAGYGRILQRCIDESRSAASSNGSLAR